ncbi:MAG: prolyl oligopeptidase family serine peptidase [Rhodoblastus sp.]|nr:prolyl oligopeptidase family serine peptidase [Rhodoblastus sp.]
MKRHVAVCILAGLASLAAARAASVCDASTPCEVASGRYYVRPPAGWDGARALPVAVYFHGYRSSAADAMADAALGEALSKAGVLLVAPDGLDGRWTIAGKLSAGRDDIAFVRDVLADLRRRYPIDERRLVATGFSAGGFMVWQIACAAGDLFAAYAPISGAFLDPIPENCPTGPASLRHVHGTADVVVPMSGRWIAGGRVRQSDVDASVARLREIDGCAERPKREERRGELVCRVWPAGACASGREIELCLHGGGHSFEPDWIVDAVNWAGRLAPPP